MGNISDNNPENSIRIRKLIDQTGSGDFQFIRIYNIDSDGITILSIKDIDLSGADYATVGNVVDGEVSVINNGVSSTASNVGNSGVGVFKQKVGVDLEFKNISSGSNKISIIDNTVDGEIVVDISSLNINTSELNNDANFTDLATAANRTNHTGTQIAATISDFDTEVSNNTNVILNTAKISADGSIDTHSDVDISTNTPVAGDILVFDGTHFIPSSVDNGYTIFPIWAEESGTLSNNNRQWSFGNGAVGNINIVIPVNCDLFAVSFDSETGGVGTVTLDIMQNDVAIHTTPILAIKDFEILSSPFSFGSGDCLGFSTNTGTGSLLNARVCAWFRIRSSVLSTSVLNDLIDVSTSTPTPGQVLQWNGSNWINATASEGITDHGALTGLADDDHTQYLNETRHDSLPSDNPHSVTKAQVGLGNVDNTSDVNKPVSTATQSALDLKYDASNPSNYIDSAGAPVQPSDIVNFETTIQLIIRDIANRNRTNHTGTQLSSTISDFTARVKIDETTTSLTVDSTGTLLTFNDEDGTANQIQTNVFGTEAQDFINTNNVNISTTTPTVARSFTTSTKPPGRYRIQMEVQLQPNSTASNYLLELQIFGIGRIGLEMEEEGQDSIEDNRNIRVLKGYYNHATQGTFDIDLVASRETGTLVIHGVSAEVWRVS